VISISESVSDLTNSLTQNRPWWIEIAIVFCLLSPGYYFGNEYIILALPFITLLYDRSTWKKIVSDWKMRKWSASAFKYLWIPCLFILLSGLNKLVNGNELRSLKDFYSSFMLLPLVLISARGIFSQRVMKLVVGFVLLETLIGILEYQLQVRSFFVPLDRKSMIFDESSVYGTRVFGLGSNSPIFGLRCLVALFLLEATDWKRYWKWIFKVVLLLGIIVSFNRSVVICCIVFYLLQLGQLVWKERRAFRQLVRNRLVHDSLATFLLFVLVFGSDFMMKGMNRDGVAREDLLVQTPVPVPAPVPTPKPSENLAEEDSVEGNKSEPAAVRIRDTHELNHNYPKLKEVYELDSLGGITCSFLQLTESIQSSGRKLIWLNYIQFIEKNPLTGNGSEKLYFTAINQENQKVELIHAHNSFLELIGTNGILLGVMYLFMIILWWRGKNFPILATIVIYSLMQYGIFWGMSFLDVIFVFLVISDVNIIDFGSKSSRT
jgi:hypothetical protein